MVVRLSGALAALLVAGFALPAATQDTVKVGNETKRAAGTVVGLTAGDTACYVKLKDDRGATTEEMADFPICEQRSLIGKRVVLTWAARKVMSPDCQGNVDCKKTVSVALIVGAQVQAAAGTPARTSFCTGDEITIFNCATSSRIVSVCAPKGAPAAGGWLQFRFGKPDAADPEIVSPEGRVPPARAALGGSVPFAGGGAAWLRFATGKVQSTVYTGIGKFGPKGEIQEVAGLVAHRDGKQIASLKCVGKPVSELGPDWFSRAGIKDGGQDFELPE